MMDGIGEEELNKVLEKVRDKLQGKGKEFITRYCLAPSCDIFLDDPTQFTCDNPHCNREVVEILRGESTLKESVDGLCKKFGVEYLKGLEIHFDELRESIDDLCEGLKVESTEKALEKVKKIVGLVEKIKKEL